MMGTICARGSTLMFSSLTRYRVLLSRAITRGNETMRSATAPTIKVCEQAKREEAIRKSEEAWSTCGRHPSNCSIARAGTRPHARHQAMNSMGSIRRSPASLFQT